MTTNAGIVTVGGMTLLVNAQMTGGTVPIDSAQISTDVMACTGQETALTDVAFTMPGSVLAFSTPTLGVLRTALYMGTAVGNFVIGTVGLFSGSTLFALAAFPGAGTKLAASAPGSAGNVRQLLVDILYQGGSVFTYAPGPIGGAAIASSLVANTTSTVTVRQLKTQLALGLSGIGLAASRNAVLKTAMASLPPDNAAVIQLDAFLVTLGDPLASLVASTFALGSSQMTALFVAAATQTP